MSCDWSLSASSFVGYAVAVYSVVIFRKRGWVRFRVFFFSSRRRHTRLVSDWSSDVCSSDLHVRGRAGPSQGSVRARRLRRFAFLPDLRTRICPDGISNRRLARRTDWIGRVHVSVARRFHARGSNLRAPAGLPSAMKHPSKDRSVPPRHAWSLCTCPLFHGRL